MRSCLLKAFFGIAFLLLIPLQARADLSGPQKTLMLRVYFSDVTSATRFTAIDVQNFADDLNTLWGTDTSYGTISLPIQISSLYQVPQATTVYLDSGGGTSSTATGFGALVKDAVAGAPAGLDWTNLHGLVILFADVRPSGFYRGWTFCGWTINAPTGTVTLPVSIVGEDPAETPTTAWGRWGHEIGHQLQTGNPGCATHPSNYNSNFEQMDANYPGQSGMYSKSDNKAYRGWMPSGKYQVVKPPIGAEVTLFAEENPPSAEPDSQAIKAFLTAGGTQLYYMISARHRIFGDDLNDNNSPTGIPDEGVLIERVVEGGDPNINDCKPNTCFRWVTVQGNGSSNTLWHLGQTYTNTIDGIAIFVKQNPDSDHYVVDVSYPEGTAISVPDVGLQSWLEPPSNTYETTDIWIDSPLNGYGNYRYGTWSDLLGGTVPKGNGDDPAIGQINRLHARVRDYGNKPASNITVYFDVTNPLGLGISGPNAFLNIGSVTSTQFPGLALINPGKFVDVWIPWTPKATLTAMQIEKGRFFFHSCVRVRLSHVTGETFFANQNGNGQQENIEYFDATAPSTKPPGSPGAPNSALIHLHNNSSTMSQQFVLGFIHDALPSTWKVTINGGNQVATLMPSEIRSIPIVVQQTATEALGSSHSFRVLASPPVAYTNPSLPQPHNELHSLGGVQFVMTVDNQTTLTCTGSTGGVVNGSIGNFTPGATPLANIQVLAEAIDSTGNFINTTTALAPVAADGTFTTTLGGPNNPVTRGTCLFAGTDQMTSSGSAIFNFP